METISSAQTAFMKWVFPVIWCGILFVFLSIATIGGGWRQQPFLLVPPLIMVGVGAMIYRKLIWDLADEVRDGGSYLLVRKGGIEQRVQLADVMNVGFSQFTNPKRISLRLRTPGPLGDEICFIPKLPLFRFNPFGRCEIVESLMRRADAARSGAGT